MQNKKSTERYNNLTYGIGKENFTIRVKDNALHWVALMVLISYLDVIETVATEIEVYTPEALVSPQTKTIRITGITFNS